MYKSWRNKEELKSHKTHLFATLCTYSVIIKPQSRVLNHFAGVGIQFKLFTLLLFSFYII